MTYKIKFDKNGAVVTITYDVRCKVGEELLATMAIYVDGPNVMNQEASGNTALSGTFDIDIDDSKDVRVSFSITTNKPSSVYRSDMLRARHNDVVEFHD